MPNSIIHVADPRTLLLVEDDEVTALSLARFLEKNGLRVTVETRGDLAMQRVRALQPGAVVLDANLPGRDGFDICRELRARYAGVIVMLTARDDQVDQIVGFELGADAYITKPAEPRLVLAQLNACLRRTGAAPREVSDRTLQYGTFAIDAAARSVKLAGKEITLTTAEFDLLWLLASNAGNIVTRDEVQKTLRGIEHDGIDRSIDMRISRLRRRLGDDTAAPRRIKTVRARGYLFSPTDWD